MILSTYAWPLWITSLGVFLFGTVVLLKDPTKTLTRLFFACSVSVSWWAFGYGQVYASSTSDSALQWARFGYLGVVFIPTFFCHFVAEFLQARFPRLIGSAYVLSLLFLLISRSDLFLTSPRVYFWGFYPMAGPLYITFIAFFYGGFATCVYYLLRVFIQMRKNFERGQKYNKVKYVLFAFCVASFSFSDYLPNYGITVYPFAYLAATGWLVIMAYGTLRFQVMDINIIIRKTLVYSTAMGVLAAVYVSFITLFTRIFQSWSGEATVYSSGVAAALVAFFFQPVRRRIQNIVDRQFFRDYVDREEKLYELSREVITHTTPEALAGALMRVLGDTFHPKSAGLYLKGRYTSSYSRMGAIGEETLPENMNSENALASYFSDHSQPFVLDPSGQEAMPRSTRSQTTGGRATGGTTEAAA